MKPIEIDALIEDCLEGRLSEADSARLSAMLEQSSEARARYWEMASIHGLLEHTLQSASLRAVTGQSWQMTAGINRWQHWRPLAAAAAGLVLGMFCTSMVFGIVMQRNSERKVAVAIHDPGFEDAAMPLAKGFSGGSARWAGDPATVVKAEHGLNPREGGTMLRLEPMERGMPRVFQVLDLATLPETPGAGMREIEISASFAATGSQSRSRYVIRAFAFSETPESLDEDWFNLREESIASASRGLDVSPDERGWQTFGLRLQIPATARSLVLVFGVRTPEKASPRVPHYLDDVQVSLIEHTLLP